MKKIEIVKEAYWYKGMIGQVFPVLEEKRTKYLVSKVDENYFYVDKTDCVIIEEELLIKLIPNAEGKCVDFPTKLEQGDWIDLRACTQEQYLSFKEGERVFISLGVAIKLPIGYESYIVPRSSLGKNHGLILYNSVGIIDNHYQGNTDCWGAWFYTTRQGVVEFNERICQFRIQKNQPTLKLTQVDNLEGVNRGGFGEGTKNVQ